MAVKKVGRPQKNKEEDQDVLKNETAGTESFSETDLKDEMIEDEGKTVDPNVIEVITDEKEGMMTHSQVMALIKEINDKNEQRTKQQIESLRQEFKREKIQPSTSSSSNLIDELQDDYLDTPVIFFAFSTHKFIHADFRNGKEILCPGEKIHFKPVIRQVKRGERGDQVVSISSVKVNSKSQVEFLRKHSGYKIQFFEELGEARNVDAVWAARLVAVHNQYSKMTDANVLSRCQELKLPILKDISEMRRNLVEYIARQEKEREIESAKARLNGSVPMGSGGKMMINSMDQNGLEVIDGTVNYKN